MSKEDIRGCQGWQVTLYPEGNGFFAQCTSPEGMIQRTETCGDKGTAWQKGYNFVDEAIAEARLLRYNAIAGFLTLMLLYVTGEDEYYDDHLLGRLAYKGHDFDILDKFEAEGLVKPQTNKKALKSVVLTDEGIKQAKNLLRNLNLSSGHEFLDGIDINV